jgi:hypothetical protein
MTRAEIFVFRKVTPSVKSLIVEALSGHIFVTEEPVDGTLYGCVPRIKSLMNGSGVVVPMFTAFAGNGGV